MKKLLLLTTILTTLLAGISAAHADRLDKSSPKIAEGMQFDVAGHLIIEATGIHNRATPTRGMYRDRGKSSPKIAPTCSVHLKQQTKCTGCTVCWFGTGHGIRRYESKSRPKIAEGMRTDVGNHLIVEATGIHNRPAPTRGMYRDRGKSSPKIAEGMRTDVAGHLLIESTGIRKGTTTTRGMYRDRGKSSPKIAEGMRSDVLGHLLIEASGIHNRATPTRGMYRGRDNDCDGELLYILENFRLGRGGR